jgi:GT2 family glycosyltransferase
MIHIPVQILSNASEFERYIHDCALSLRRQDGVGDKYRLTVNVALYEPVSARAADTLKALAADDFAVNLIELYRTCGYGEKQNLIWNNYTKKLAAPFEAFITVNPDMVLMPDVVDKLHTTFAASGGRANIVEARQFPIENPPRTFDAATLEVNWCSGACILLSAAFFERCKGFDETIYLYCEDVDLSWRAWLDGGQCLYRHDAVVAHMTHGLFEARYNRHSVPTHESYMALSHLILTWKYFSADEALLASKMKLFWENQGFARHTKEAAFAEFETIKPRIERQTTGHPRIELLDLGLYSAMRPNLI